MVPKIIVAALLATAVVGCNGSNGGFSGGGSGGGAVAPGAAPGSSTVEFGSGTGGNFQAGTLAVATEHLSAGGTTTVKATLVNSDGTPYTGDAAVNFISTCVQQGTAKIDSPVDAENGAAVTSYTAQGCSGSDTITATVTINGTQLSATGVLTVAAAQLGSIAFISADPSTISFEGSGLTETSRVTFEVRDATGNPLPGRKVNFALSTNVGGITLSQSSATSGADGQVATVVQAGTIPTPVRVEATVDGTGVGTQSSVLTISTGIADADSFSIAIETLNPEAFNVDGVTDAVTVRLADRFNNPVPDGTAISFRTEGGSIQGSCQTKNGTCSVDWVSQDPRPDDGRVSIFAYVIGEESFTDKNGNGVFDNVDTFFDLGEPFEDNNEDGAFEIGEPFYDFNHDQKRNGPDTHYEGLLCKTNCGPGGETADSGQFMSSTTGIGAGAVLVMSGSEAVICTTPAGSPAVCLDPVPTIISQGSVLSLYVSDMRGQPMPEGTTISVDGTNVDLAGETSFTVPNTIAVGAAYAVQVGGIQDTTKPANITVKVTSPGSVISEKFFTVN